MTDPAQDLDPKTLQDLLSEDVADLCRDPQKAWDDCADGPRMALLAVRCAAQSLHPTTLLDAVEQFMTYDVDDEMASLYAGDSHAHNRAEIRFLRIMDGLQAARRAESDEELFSRCMQASNDLWNALRCDDLPPDRDRDRRFAEALRDRLPCNPLTAVVPDGPASASEREFSVHLGDHFAHIALSEGVPRYAVRGLSLRLLRPARGAWRREAVPSRPRIGRPEPTQSGPA